MQLPFLLFLLLIGLFDTLAGQKVQAPADQHNNSSKPQQPQEQKQQQQEQQKQDKQPQPLAKVDLCTVCNCTAELVDCSSRKLNTSLHDHQWPAKPIQTVDFSNNQISRIKPLPNVTIARLIYRNNAISAIDDHSFKFVYNLTELDLSHNRLTYETLSPHSLRGRFSSESYEPLRKLRKLDLSWNNFTSLKQNIFEHVADLKILNLSHNPLKVYDLPITLAINGLPYLEELDMSACQLKNVDAGVLHNLRGLKKLNLSYNNFTDPPHMLEDANPIEQLILDGNPIKKLSVDNAFPTMLKLKELSMSNMPVLKTIGKSSLCHLQALKVLRIENCANLTDIDEFALGKEGKEGGSIWPPIKKLQLTNNSLHYLPANLVARWDEVQELHITGNQWNCDCDNQDLVGLILPMHGMRLMGNESLELRCASPPEHKNRTLASLAGRLLRCPDLYGARPERDAAVLVGMLIGVLLAVPLVLGFFLLWSRGFFFCGRQGPATFSRAFYRRAPPYEREI